LVRQQLLLLLHLERGLKLLVLKFQKCLGLLGYLLVWVQMIKFLNFLLNVRGQVRLH